MPRNPSNFIKDFALPFAAADNAQIVGSSLSLRMWALRRREHRLKLNWFCPLWPFFNSTKNSSNALYNISISTFCDGAKLICKLKKQKTLLNVQYLCRKSSSSDAGVQQTSRHSLIIFKNSAPTKKNDVVLHTWSADNLLLLQRNPEKKLQKKREFSHGEQQTSIINCCCATTIIRK